MESDGEKKNNPTFQSIFLVVAFALIMGTAFAFAIYLLQFQPGDPWHYSDDVKNDTAAKIVKRFLIGAGGGATIGVLHIIRNWRKK
jgi:hypothetical protein